MYRHRHRPNYSVFVRLGDLNLDDSVVDGATPIDMPIEEIIVHPEFATRPPVNDIALIKLKSPVEYTSKLYFYTLRK